MPNEIFLICLSFFLPKIYCLVNPRIAFLLKESNNDFINIRNNDHDPQKGNSGVFWRNINIWSYIITEIFNNRSVDFNSIYDIKEMVVNSIAYINIKKNLENKSFSNYIDLKNYAVNDKDFLIKQIDIIDPQVIVCGGTKNLYDLLYDDSKQIYDWIYFSNNRLVIDFWHPASRKAYKNTFDSLTKLLSNNEVKRLLVNFNS